jgi:preprotein translocase subunit SecE
MANSGDKSPAPAPAPASTPAPRKTSFANEVWVELKKTTWPTLPEAWRLTTVVLAVIVAIAVYIGLVDFILTVIFNRFHLIK